MPSGESEVFVSKITGEIVENVSGRNSPWMANIIFRPDGQDKTLAEMDEKSQMDLWTADGWWSQLTDYLSKKYL